jgi:hypothetical protein
MDISQIVAELGAYVMQNPNISSWIYQDSAYINRTTTLTKVNGKYPSFSGILTNVVQEFTTNFNALGEAKFFVKPLESFRQKVDFIFEPQDLNDTWLSHLKVEGLSPEQMPISVWMMMELQKRVKDDLHILEGTGVYTAGTGLFGDSMDGMVTVMDNLLSAGNPFKIPIPAITDTNIVDVVDVFDRSIPGKMRRLIKEYYMSNENLDRYRFRYKKLYGRDLDYTTENSVKAWGSGKQIVGFDSWDGSDHIMATLPENWVRLIDMVDEPRITSVQLFNRSVKLLMDFTLAYNFRLDETVFLADPGGLTRGLDTNHSLYYPEVPTTPIPILS